MSIKLSAKWPAYVDAYRAAFYNWRFYYTFNPFLPEAKRFQRFFLRRVRRRFGQRYVVHLF